MDVCVCAHVDVCVCAHAYRVHACVENSLSLSLSRSLSRALSLFSSLSLSRALSRSLALSLSRSLALSLQRGVERAHVYPPGAAVLSEDWGGGSSGDFALQPSLVGSSDEDAHREAGPESLSTSLMPNIREHGPQALLRPVANDQGVAVCCRVCLRAFVAAVQGGMCMCMRTERCASRPPAIRCLSPLTHSTPRLPLSRTSERSDAAPRIPED